jgi:hypothetical protein
MFTHPPPCCKWIRTFRNYGIMMPFSVITLQQNILNISELLPHLWWMDKRQNSAPCNPCHEKIPFLRRNRVDILKEINVHVGKNIQCDSRSARCISNFQSCYGVVCPESCILNVHGLSQACIKKGISFSCHEKKNFMTTLFYIYTHTHTQTC